MEQYSYQDKVSPPGGAFKYRVLNNTNPVQKLDILECLYQTKEKFIRDSINHLTPALKMET